MNDSKPVLMDADRVREIRAVGNPKGYLITEDMRRGILDGSIEAWEEERDGERVLVFKWLDE